ncbi:MAG TPA: DsbA family protein [Anaeromyxobacteraceae bacterium]|nr:DsbA family protein [Anaeromyxobacteraceae bacterium]
MAARPASDPIRLQLHGDVLDPWSWIAEKRIATAADTFHGRFAPLEHVPLCWNWEARAPTAAECRRRARELVRAAREVDAPPFSGELWKSGGSAPQSSKPAVIAIAAAQVSSKEEATTLRKALREAALVSGLDVSRKDVILEVAERAGLNLSRFAPAVEAPATERAVLDAMREGVDLGLKTGPALVIEEDWLVAGLRSLREYRSLLKRYLVTHVGALAGHTIH